MPIIHHPVLRVNADVPEPHVEILAESGWLDGPHPDTDPDYPMQVLPASEPEPAPRARTRSTPQDPKE